MRFHDVVIFEACYGVHLLQLLRRRLFHRAVDTILNAVGQ
jgi:hypothetical protein